VVTNPDVGRQSLDEFAMEGVGILFIPAVGLNVETMAKEVLNQCPVMPLSPMRLIRVTVVVTNLVVSVSLDVGKNVAVVVFKLVS